MMGHRRFKKDRRPLRGWEFPNTPQVIDEMTALFGEVLFLQEFLHMAKFKDLLNGAGSAPTGVAVEDDTFSQQFPLLYQLMAVEKDDDGSKRLTCTLTIVCEDGSVKCGINERNHHMSLWVTTDRLGSVYTALEEALNARPVQWRKTNWKGRGGRP